MTLLAAAWLEISLISHRPNESQELHTSILWIGGLGIGDRGIGTGIKSTASAAVAVKCKLFMKCCAPPPGELCLSSKLLWPAIKNLAFSAS